MKYLIFIALCIISACEDPTPIKTPEIEPTPIIEKPKEEYHIKVVPYGNWPEYVIHFTNDNWQTQTELLVYYPEINMTNPLFNTFDEAVAVAKGLDTYEKALKHNQRATEAAYSKQKNRPQAQIH